MLNLRSATPQRIQSLEIGIGLYRKFLAIGRSASLTEIAAAGGMHPSKAHRYLVSLIRCSLVEQDGRGRYRIVPHALGGQRGDASWETAIKYAEPALVALAKKTGQTVFLSTWGVTGPRIIRVEEPERPISVRPTTVGDLPLWNTSSGRIFAAYMDRGRVAPLLEAELRALKRSSSSASEQARFFRLLDEARRRGLARTTGERYPGLNSMSAPIFDPNGAVILAITAFGLHPTFPADWDSPIAKAVAACASAVSQRIGGRPRD
jgi:DNA-binding IclR family transcriptional regulator